MKNLVIILALALALPLAAGDAKKSDHAKHGDHAKHSDHGTAAGHHEEGSHCDMQANAEGTAVEMDGTLLCLKCDLKKADKCEKVFRPAGDEEKLLAICHGSKADVEKLSQHGGVKLHIKGKMVKCGEDGKDELYIEEAKAL